MARTAGTSARTQRLIAIVATCLLGAVTAFAIGRVFLGHAATYRMLAAALASALIACALERRNLLVATAASALALLVVIGLLIFPATTWHGIPTLDTLRAIGHAAGLVGQQARVEVAPSAPLPPLMLAALTALWAAVFSAHALAFRAGSPLLSLLPPIALVAFADTVLDQFVKPFYGIAFLAAALLVIFADGLRRLQGWGPVWTGPGRDAQLTRTAGRGARRVAFACLGLALLAPALLPGFGSKAIFDFSTNGSGHVTLDPFVSVANQLSQSDPVNVFTVETTHPTYYRMVALPNYDGTTWSPQTDPTVQELGQGQVPTPDVIADSEVGVAQAGPLTRTFHTQSELDLSWLPVPYPVTSTTLNQPLHLDPEQGSLALDQPLGPSITYQTTSLSISPTPADLEAIPEATPAQNSAYTSLPQETQDAVGALAVDWTKGATTQYDKVMAVLRKLHSPPFFYDSNVPGHDGSFALMDFLKTTHKGFCQQFAGSMAVILRALGIPARVAVGYTGGKEIKDGLYQVTSKDAHAWVEVLFPTYGWLTFDPTPSGNDQNFLPYNNPTTTPSQVKTPVCKGKKCQTGNPTPTPPRPIPPDLRGGGKGRSTTGGSLLITVPHKTITARRVIGAALLLGFLILLFIPPVRALRRRRKLRRAAGEPRRLILATYDVFTEQAGELGFPRGPGETLEEYRRRVAATGRLSDGHLDRLTKIASTAAYASEEPEPGAPQAAAEAAETTLRDLRRTTPFGRRILGHYRREV